MVWINKNNVPVSNKQKQKYLKRNVRSILFKTLHVHGLKYLSDQLIHTIEPHYTRAAANNILVLPQQNCEVYKTSMQ